jgi:ATP-dependent DNA helicase PIF1
MELNEKQQFSYDLITGRPDQPKQCVFVSGPGGVGKSTVINKVRSTAPDSTIFMAPTGIAALNIEGSTVHRTFGFPIGFLDQNRRRRVSKKAQELFESDTIKRIVLDEVSMVRGDLFSAIDQNLRLIKGNKKPFGGIQMVVSGDFYQLSPVINNKSFEGELYNQEFRSPYAFDTVAWEKAGFLTVELDQIMRQNDPTYKFALNSIRVLDHNAYKALQYINKIGMTNAAMKPDADMLMLCATNADADAVNRIKYAEVEGKEFYYQAKIEGDFKDEPVPTTLALKVGCKVLISANHQDGEYVNGDRGVITHLTESKIRVLTDTGRAFDVEQHEWDAIDYSVQDGVLLTTVIGSFIQFPIKLGWAITIHKSQGMTLNEAAIYTGRGCFTFGQAYVALSRLRSIEGLNIMQQIGYNELLVDDRVKMFYIQNSLGNLFEAAL